MQALLKSDGQVLSYPPKSGKYTLEELQKAVGGYIEIVHLSDGSLMVVNEEGKLMKLPVNLPASLLYGGSDCIVGDVLLCNTEDIE